MNKLVQELAYTSAQMSDTNLMKQDPKFVDQFAELVIGEIVDYCLSMQIGNQYTPEEMLFQAKYRRIVREHFELT